MAMKRLSSCGGLLLSLLACVANAPAVHAQYAGGRWEGPYFSAVGGTLGGLFTTSTADPNATIFSYAWGPYPMNGGVPSPLPGYNYASLRGDQFMATSSIGTYTIKYIYKGYYSGQQTTPPLLQSKMYLQEVSSVSWQASGYKDDGYNHNILVVGSGNADNGRKDPVVLNPDQTGGTSSGVHLLQQDGSSGMVTFNVSPSAWAKLNMFGIPYALGGAGTMFNYQWQLDTRSVIIVCPAIEGGGNYHKKSIGVSPTANMDVPEANVRNSDGSITVDTIPSNLFYKFWKFYEKLEASTTGFDVASTNIFGKITNTQFEWTPEYLSDSSPVPSNWAFKTGDYNQLPATYSSHIKVTDLRPNLYAVAENDYTIIIHKPYENGRESAPRVFDHNVKFPWTTQIMGGANVDVSMVAQQPREWSLMGQSFNNVAGSFLAGVCGSGSVALFFPEATTSVVIADMVFNVIGWVVQNSGTPEPTNTISVTGDYASFTNAISEQQTISAHPNDPTLNDIGIDCPEDTRIFCGDSLQKIVANPEWYWSFGNPKGRCHKGDRYIKYTVTGDGYGVNGYIGPQTNYPVVQVRKLEKVWEWTVDSQPIL